MHTSTLADILAKGHGPTGKLLAPELAAIPGPSALSAASSIPGQDVFDDGPLTGVPLTVNDIRPDRDGRILPAPILACDGRGSYDRYQQQPLTTSALGDDGRGDYNRFGLGPSGETSFAGGDGQRRGRCPCKKVQPLNASGLTDDGEGRGGYNHFSLFSPEALGELNFDSDDGRGGYNRFTTGPLGDFNLADDDGRGGYNRFASDPLGEFNLADDDGRGGYNRFDLDTPNALALALALAGEGRGGYN